MSDHLPKTAKDAEATRLEEQNLLPGARSGYVGFQLTGKDPAKWGEFYFKLFARIEQLVEFIVQEDDTRSWLASQAKDLTTLAIDSVKAKLSKTNLKAEEIDAEVVRLLADQEKVWAEARKIDSEARKINAEARAIELDTKIKELRVALSISRAMLIGDRNKPVLLLGRQVDAMLESLNSLEATDYGTTVEPLGIYIDPGDAPQQLISELYATLHSLYRARGGSGLQFVKDEQKSFVGEEATP